MDKVEALAAKVEAMEKRIHDLESEREIRNLLSVHDYTFDSKRDDQWLALWTEDGAYDMLSTVKYPDGSTREFKYRWSGLSGLLEFISNPEGHHRPGFYGRSMHFAGHNLVVYVDGDRATANSYSYLFQESGGAVSLLSAGNNQWKFKKVAGVWKLQERRHRQIGSAESHGNLDATLR